MAPIRLQAEREAYLQFQRLQLEEQRQAECTGRPNLAGSFAEAVNTAVAAAVEAAVKATKAERDTARKSSPARQQRKKRIAAQDAAREVARARSPSPEKERQVTARQRENVVREGRGAGKQRRQRLRRDHCAQFDDNNCEDSMKVKPSTRSTSRYRQADVEEKLATLEKFRLENLRLEKELAETKLKETQTRLANRPTTPGDRQRAWEHGRQERELLKALEEREASAVAKRAQMEARARQREDHRMRRRDARHRSTSPSERDDAVRSVSPRSRLSPADVFLEKSISPNREAIDQQRQSQRRRPVRDLSAVPTMSSRHKKTTVDRTGGPGAHLRDKTNVSDTRTQRDLKLQADAAVAAASTPPRPGSTRHTRERSSSLMFEESSRSIEFTMQLAGEHTMSSRHRKTTATPRARVDASDLSHGGVTAAELFAKFQSGQHLRDGRSTAEATQSGDRRRTRSPARRKIHSPASSRSVHQQDSSARLSTPSRKRGTLFQQSQAEQEAVALVRPCTCCIHTIIDILVQSSASKWRANIHSNKKP